MEMRRGEPKSGRAREFIADSLRFGGKVSKRLQQMWGRHSCRPPFGGQEWLLDKRTGRQPLRSLLKLYRSRSRTHHTEGLMAKHDIAHFISGYSTHFFPPNAAIPVFITLYKTGSASADDVAGYLMFTDQPLTDGFQDRLQSEPQAIVKHFHMSQFGAVMHLLQLRLDHLKQGVSMHYMGEDAVGGWTTLDAGASPGLDPALLPYVTSPVKRALAPAASVKKPALKKKTTTKK
jgi:hypothetical protein